MPPEPAVRSSQLAALLAEPPPRRFVPPELERAAVAQAAPWPTALFGGLFALLGSVFAAVLVPWNLPEDWKLDHGAAATGQVLAVVRTNTSVNKRRVMRYEFVFPTPAGAPQRAACFATGVLWRKGEEVPVRYLPDDPSVARIEGARRSETNASALFVLVFPAVGTFLVVSFVRARRRTRALLRNGVAEEARVTAIEQTAMRVNRSPVQKITLQRADGGTLVVRYHQSALVDLTRQRLAAKDPVYVLYNPARSKEVLLPEALL